jgi:hypothetical protein
MQVSSPKDFHLRLCDIKSYKSYLGVSPNNLTY